MKDLAKQEILFLVVIVTLSFLLALFFYKGSGHPIKGDAQQYNIIAQNLLRHRAYSLSPGPPYLPTTLREPGYAFFLAFLIWLFKGNYVAIYGTQVVLYLLTVVLVYYLSAKILGKGIARWVTLLTGLCPTLANYPGYLLSETLFTFLIILFMLAILRAVEVNRTAWYICSGLLLGLCALTKCITVLLFVPIAFCGVLYSGNINLFFRKYAKNFVIFVVTFLVIVAPWSIRNYAAFGKFSLSLHLGRVLLVRGAKLDYSLRDTKKEILFILSEYLGKKFYPDVEEPNNFLLKEAIENEQQIKKMIGQGYNEVEINQIQIKQALVKIKRRPLKYLSQNFLEWFKMTAFLHIPLLSESDTIERFKDIKNGQLILSAVRGVFRLAAYLTLFFAFFGFLSQGKKWRQWVFIAALIIYTNLTYSFLFGSGRYNVPLIPFYFMFAVAGFNFIKNKNKFVS
ncbi:ArnT family glycosyltransferase [Candidatus Omnitrophota bacterium]